MRSIPLLTLTFVFATGCGISPPALSACSAANPNSAVLESTPDSDFVVDELNGIVKHLKTGLMWKRCAEGQSGTDCSASISNGATFDWRGALASASGANDSSYGGFNDWRLPNKKELESLVELCGYQPAINQNIFPRTPPDNFFWTSTSYGGDARQAWMVTSGNGASGYDMKSSIHYVRLVRGGESVDSFDSLRRMRRVTGPALRAWDRNADDPSP